MTELEWISIVPVAYDERGEATLAFSPVVPGSGLEPALQIGSTYAAGIGGGQAAETSALQRAEPMERAEALAEAFDAAHRP